jgi:hypothetical protein
MAFIVPALQGVFNAEAIDASSTDYCRCADFIARYILISEWHYDLSSPLPCHVLATSR